MRIYLVLVIFIAFLSAGCSDDSGAKAKDSDVISDFDTTLDSDAVSDKDSEIDVATDKEEDVIIDQEETLPDEQEDEDNASEAEKDPIDSDLTDMEDDADETEDSDEIVDCSSFSAENALIKNGSFMEWQDGFPLSWYGTKTSTENDFLIYEFKSGHSCGSALKLENESSNHRRFTTEAVSFIAGEYNCSFWAKGSGEIRGGFYDGDFDYGSWDFVTREEWKEHTYSFKLNEDVTDIFEFILSVKNTGSDMDHLQIDDVVCERADEFCDTVTCDEWQVCSNEEKKCVTAEGRCGESGECNEWEECSTGNYCTTKDGRCNSTAECDVNSDKPVCDLPSHSCIAGDPCAGVTCDEWKECNPDTALCVLSEGRCVKTIDCKALLPACDSAAHNCVGSESAVNIFPNGNFEAWDTYDIPYQGEHLLPDYWYGLDFLGGDNTGSTEIAADKVIRIDSGAHTGSYALQIVFPGMPADRFTSEGFTVPVGNYSCHYFVKGKGDIRHRWYSKMGWSTNTEFVAIDSAEWVQMPFEMSFPGGASAFRFIIYASNTVEASGHLQIDDVVCTAH